MTSSGEHGRGRVAGTVVGAIVALGLAVAPAAAAAADVDPGGAVYVGGKEGYGGTGVFPIWSDGAPAGDPDYWAYCVEHDVSAESGLVGTVADDDDFLGANHFVDAAVRGRVLWVLAHSYPAVDLDDFGVAAGAPGISRNDAIEATQYAIWRYTDLDFDASWAFETPDSEAAYWYLVDGANASTGLAPADLAVTAGITAPAAPQTAGSLVGPFVVTTDQAAVQVSVAPSVAVTDEDGNPVDLGAVVDGQELYLDLRAATAAGGATLRVAAEGAGGSGRIVSVPTVPGGVPTAGDHAQTIILIAPSTATTTAEAAVSWAAVGASTGSDPELVETGSSAPIAIAALALLALLSGLVLARRRRATGA